MSIGLFDASIPPQWTPHDLSDITDPEELRAALARAFDEFHNDYVPRRLAYLRSRPALRFEGTAAWRAITDEIKMLMSHQGFARAAPLFTYSNNERVIEQLNQGLRVSWGADNEFLHQRGKFPRGLYGTTIEPWRQGMSRGAMRLNFFDREYAMPSVVSHIEFPDSGRTALQANVQRPLTESQSLSPRYDGPRAELPTGRFVAFAQTSDWAPRGHLNFPDTRHEHGDRFLHYSRKVQPGESHIEQPIVAIGNNLIPDGPISVRGRSSSLPTIQPVQTMTRSPRAPGSLEEPTLTWENVTDWRATRRSTFSGSDSPIIRSLTEPTQPSLARSAQPELLELL